METDTESAEAPEAPARREPGPGAVSAAEYRYVFAAAALVMAVTCLPYLLCQLRTPPGRVYPGILFNADDHAVYFAWMRQARDGHFFLRDLFTSEPQSGRYVHLYFWMLGTLSRLTGLPIPVAYHLGRVVSGIVVLMLVYRLGSFFAREVLTRRVIFWTSALSSGFGWLFWQPRVSMAQPVDAWQPEALTFQSLYTNGLFAVSMALMLGVVLCLLLAQIRGASRYALGAGACGLLLANIHTYDVITLTCVWSAYLLGLALAGCSFLPRLRDALVATAVASPAIAYQLWFYRAESLFQRRVAVPTHSPWFHLYLLGYGLLLPLAVYGCWLLFRSTRLRGAPYLLLPPIWLVVGLAVPYMPVAFQRKMVMGVHFPLALLAGVGISGLTWLLYPRGTPSVRRALAALVVAATAITPVLFVRRDIELALDGNVTSTGIHPVWWPAADFAAMNWMGAHLPGDAVILGNPLGTLLIPATSGRAVYAGHWGETPDFQEKFNEARHYFSGEDPEWGDQFLRVNRITHVIYGEPERTLSRLLESNGHPGFQPVAPLEPVFRSGETVVYAVRR